MLLQVELWSYKALRLGRGSGDIVSAHNSRDSLLASTCPIFGRLSSEAFSGSLDGVFDVRGVSLYLLSGGGAGLFALVSVVGVLCIGFNRVDSEPSKRIWFNSHDLLLWVLVMAADNVLL